jgi:hypothetical protein
MKLDEINNLTIDDLLDFKRSGKKITLDDNSNISSYRLKVEEIKRGKSGNGVADTFGVSEQKYKEYQVYFDNLLLESNFLRQKLIRELSLKNTEMTDEDKDEYTFKFLEYAKANLSQREYELAIGGLTSLQHCYRDLKPIDLSEFALITFCLTACIMDKINIL